MLIYRLQYLEERYNFTLIISYPSEAINAGIATTIKPNAAVAVSNDVLTPSKQLLNIIVNRFNYFCEYYY